MQLPHEVLLRLVSLDSDLIDGVLDLAVRVDIVLITSDHVIFGEVVLTVVLGLLVRG